jgi:hypothetical protein
MTLHSHTDTTRSSYFGHDFSGQFMACGLGLSDNGRTGAPMGPWSTRLGLLSIVAVYFEYCDALSWSSIQLAVM